MDGVTVSVRWMGSEKTRKYDLLGGSRVMDLIEKMELNSEELVVRLNDKIVPEEERLNDGDKLELIPVVSGG